MIVLAWSCSLACCCKRGQVSIEYLLLFAAFFAVLGVVLPAVSFSVDAFFVSSDFLIAEKVLSDASETISLFSFLSDGSRKSFVYYPSKSIVFFQEGGFLVVSAGDKNVRLGLEGAKFFGEGEYFGGFEVVFEKNQGEVVIRAESVNKVF